jgi:hypothetical protein
MRGFATTAIHVLVQRTAGLVTPNQWLEKAKNWLA